MHPALPLSAPAVAEALAEAGIGVEAGVWTVEDAERLAAWPHHGALVRILVEPVDVPAADAVAVVDAIHAALDRNGVGAPRLQHGDGASAWVLLGDAIRRRIDTRIGLEDTLHDPGGEPTAGNAALVRAARTLGAKIE